MTARAGCSLQISAASRLAALVADFEGERLSRSPCGRDKRGDWGDAMDASALLLSRLQFAFTVSFHIIFPSFTIGLAAWLTTIEALHLATGRPAYRIVFEFWLKIFGAACSRHSRRDEIRLRQGLQVVPDQGTEASPQ